VRKLLQDGGTISKKLTWVLARSVLLQRTALRPGKMNWKTYLTLSNRKHFPKGKIFLTLMEKVLNPKLTPLILRYTFKIGWAILEQMMVDVILMLH